MSELDFHNRSCQRKRRYWNEVDAMIAANKRIADGEEHTLRAYQCKLCDGGWHLTKAARMYVDHSIIHTARSRGARRMSCCHLFTDGESDALHKFALSIKLKLGWFQPEPYPHYDLMGVAVRLLAIKHGATEVDRKEAIRILRIASPRESMSS